MKLEEAQYHLASDFDEAEEIYEEQIFELKQFFVSRFPVRKLFVRKLEKIQLLNDAYVTLGGELSSPESESASYDFPDELLKAFDYYFKERNRLKQVLFAAADGVVLKEKVEELINLTTAFAVKWEVKDKDWASGIVSNEPDPMELRAALLDFEKNGGVVAKDLLTLEEKNILVAESKRLSLWLKMDEHGGRI